MQTDPDFQDKEKSHPAKPGGLELIAIITFLLFVAWGTYEFGFWLIKHGSKSSQETEQFL